MNNEELEKILNIKKEIEEKQKEIEKIFDPKEVEELIKNDKNATITLNKEVHVTRGRLLKTYKMNRDYIEELYDKYDMFINIYNILNREENDNYTSSDKINDIKNSTIKKEYTPFEEKILAVINNNLDDLEKMTKELNGLDDNHGIRDLIELKETYNEELKKHRENIDTRYKNEFLRKKATLPTIFTVLPKAIGLACKKVANCIKERKEAKTNKAKFNKMMKTMGAIGQVVATPVIYAGKFIIDHWYLLLLLLLALPKLSWWPFGKKRKEKEKSDDDELQQEQEQEVTVPETEQEPVLVHDGEKEGEFVPVPQPELKPAIDYASDPRFQAPKEPAAVQADTPAKPAIDYASDPRFQAPKEPVAVQADTPAKPAIDYASDPRFQAPKEPVQASDTAKTEMPHMTEEEVSAVDELNNRFIDDLENQYGYVIGSRHQEIQIVHSAEEYVDAVHAMNPYAPVNTENAMTFYQNHMSTFFNHPTQASIIWPEGDDRVHFFETEQDLATHIASGENQELNMYYQRFIQDGGNLSLFDRIGKIYERSDYAEFMNKLGIGGTGALVIFCLYEAAQYGLAAPTGGLSLALPF